MNDKSAKFGIGAIVRHRVYPFRGVVVDVDPEFDNTDEWYEAIPAEVRPDKEQPFYHLLAEIRTAIIQPMSASRICFPMVKTAR